MTTLAALLGALPLMLGTGTGASCASRWASPWWAG
jgi:multidrug efflux pump subunit AcrB